ncbi:MAG: pimeloyl-ACP methyl ester carboxylesterase, partial [Glaciecola sp.]
MQYAEHMGRKVGFKVLGDGPTNVLFMPSFVSNLDLIFGTPFVGEFLEGIAEFSRLIVYDKAGTGVSDPLDQLLTLEDRVDEAATVMAAADVEHAVIMGLSEGGPAAILLAATRPELVDGLVIFGSYAFGAESFKEHHLAADHEAMGLSGFLPSGAQLEIMREFDGHVREHWGDGRALGTLTPSLAATATGREHLALYERSSASPGMAKAVWKAAMAVNVLDVLPTIDVPTLVVHFTDD